MKNSIVTLVASLSVCLLFVGGCSIMDDLGNFHLSGAVIALFGAFNLLMISRRCNLE